MNDSTAAPDSGLMYSLYDGAFKPQIVRLALLLDAFTPLAAGPAPAESVARACGCDPSGMRVLLDYLASLHLLERQGDNYSLTPTAATFLVRGQPSYAGDCVLAYTGPLNWEGMLQALRSGRPSEFREPHAQDARIESYSTSRMPYGLDLWRAAGIEPGRRPGLRVLDLACGCAVKSLVLAKADPTVHVTCLDSAEVLEVTRDLADRMQVLPQVVFLSADLLTVDLGEGCYDAALLGQITFYLTPAENASLFRRVHAALSPGGVLVIDAIMASAQPSEWASFMTLFMWASSGGAAHSFADYRRWLEDAGFRTVRQLGERWLSATM